MIDFLIWSLPLLFIALMLLIAFLLPFLLKRPANAILSFAVFCPLAGVAIGFLAAVTQPRSGSHALKELMAGVGFGCVVGLMWTSAGFLGQEVRFIVLKQRFTLRAGMLVIAVFGVLFGVIRMVVSFAAE